MRIHRWIGSVFFATTLALVASVGCNRQGAEEKKDPVVAPPIVQVDNNKDKKDNTGKKIDGLLMSRTRPSFKNDVILDPPDGELIPPDKTVTGKSVGRIFEMIANDLWEKVAFTTSDGRSIKYRAVMTTELGDIHVDLFGDSAPNHVRSFVCLARAGYFDDMTFYYSLHAKVEDSIAAYIETGCPNGSGEAGCGSIGYWLKPEISAKLVHDEGVLGACLNGDPNTAACRFYIAAARMPQMDRYFTIFGKVSKGLDIVRAINKRTVYQEKDDASKLNRLREPVLIRTVSIHADVD